MKNLVSCIKVGMQPRMQLTRFLYASRAWSGQAVVK